ncbi:MAG: DUF4954 family protein [Bacteroidales bacterium]
MVTRAIHKSEIERLENQGCTCDDWTMLMVKEGFNPSAVRNSHFSGNVSLGLFHNLIEVEQDIYRPTGVYNSFIQNSGIDDNCLVSNVNIMCNYQIASNVVLENIGNLIVHGEAYFGNGVKIAVINEAGGRELTMYEDLTAQIAYLMVLYRHDKAFTESIQTLVDNYVDSKKSTFGKIDKNVFITNTKSIKNVNIGESAKIEGANFLENGTVCSSEFSPAYIGFGVTIKDFIVHHGSKIDGNSVINNCFVGQGVQLGKSFTADHSAFFANCEGFQSEVCAVFAGPYTITHHKPTLLIAGLYSFFNAGSGTNQSNHMYKLGPVHQGILERGVKTGSFSYIMWPSRIGAYSVVIGKHLSNFDSSDFPFSYINEADGKTKLIPGFNLFTVGTRRDVLKWQRRDKRYTNDRLDLIHFELLNPHIVGKILNAIKILKRLSDKAPYEQESLTYKGLIILTVMLKNALKYYDLAVKSYIGNEIVHKLADTGNLKSMKTIWSRLDTRDEEISEKWVDLAGMYIPINKITLLINAIKSSEINTLDSLAEQLRTEYLNYRKYSWAWCANLIKEYFKININQIEPNQLIDILNTWKESSLQLNSLTLKDAEKEFNKNSRIGYGIDAQEESGETSLMDFENVRGKMTDNSFVKSILDENSEISNKYNQLVEVINGFKQV